jgi:DNA-binding transcriptional MerR regulator
MALGAVSKGKTASPKSAGKLSPPTEIPDKLMFRIGEVSRIVGVETYVLRYWETEFPQLSPKKSGSGHRMYRRKEVEQLLLIRELLYERQYTIKGARNYLRELAQRRGGEQESETAEGAPAVEAAEVKPTLPAAKDGNVFDIGELRDELRRILSLLG